MVDIGSGPPLVLVPGVQGRWEWMRPTVDALATRFRVLTFSLSGNFDEMAAQIDAAIDRASVPSAALCGVSFGGRVAIHYAATRPGRVSALILASTPGPGWRPDARVSGYVSRPLWSAPFFIARTPGRLWDEVRAARGSIAGGVMFLARHGLRALVAPMKPLEMAERVGLLDGIDVVAEARGLAKPTLVVTGEPALDRVTDVDDTRRFVELIPGARLATLQRTGHIGTITRPFGFTTLVAEFIEESL